MAAPLIDRAPAVLIDECLAHLGALVRRAEAETLTEDEFRSLTTSTRIRLLSLQAQLAEAVPHERIELTEIGAAVGRLLDAGLLKPGGHIAEAQGRRRGHLTLVGGADLTPRTGD